MILLLLLPKRNTNKFIRIAEIQNVWTSMKSKLICRT